MVGVEHRMREDGVLAQQVCRQGRVGLSQLLVEGLRSALTPVISLISLAMSSPRFFR
jgi:hypothetical protein